MPVVTEETAVASRGRRRSAKALFLLLVPPLLLLGFLACAMFRPLALQLGPMCLLTASAPAPGAPFGWMRKAVSQGETIAGPDGNDYGVTGGGTLTAMTVPGRKVVIGWFPGQRK